MPACKAQVGILILSFIHSLNKYYSASTIWLAIFPGQEYRIQQYIKHAKILALRTHSSGVEADHKQNASNKYTLYKMDRRVAGQSFQEMLFRTMFL